MADTPPDRWPEGRWAGTGDTDTDRWGLTDAGLIALARDVLGRYFDPGSGLSDEEALHQLLEILDDGHTL